MEIAEVIAAIVNSTKKEIPKKKDLGVSKSKHEHQMELYSNSIDA